MTTIEIEDAYQRGLTDALGIVKEQAKRGGTCGALRTRCLWAINGLRMQSIGRQYASARDDDEARREQQAAVIA